MNKYRKKARRYYRSLRLDKSYLGSQLAVVDSLETSSGKHLNNDNVDKSDLARNKNEYLTMDDLHKLYDRFVLEYKNGTLGQNYVKYLNGYVYKTDIFAMGLLLKDISNKLGYNKHLKPLVIRMCAVDPNKRPIITDCIEYLDALLAPNPTSAE